MLLILTNPLIPNVDGNIQENTFQNVGTAAPGQESPELNRSGTEVKT